MTLMAHLSNFIRDISGEEDSLVIHESLWARIPSRFIRKVLEHMSVTLLNAPLSCLVAICSNWTEYAIFNKRIDIAHFLAKTKQVKVNLAQYVYVHRDYKDLPAVIKLFTAPYNRHLLNDGGIAATYNGRTALSYACELCRCSKIIKLLVSAGADVNAVDPLTGWTPIFYAHIHGYYLYLCDHGADVLRFMCYKQNKRLFRVLYLNEPIDAAAVVSENFLQQAVWYYGDIVPAQIARDISENVIMQQQQQAVCYYGHHRDNLPIVNARDISESFIMQQAVRHCGHHGNIVPAQIVNARDIKGNNVVHWAVKLGNMEALNTLHNEAAELFTQTNHKLKTPLHYWKDRYIYLEFVVWMISVHELDYKQRTPYMRFGRKQNPYCNQWEELYFESREVYNFLSKNSNNSLCRQLFSAVKYVARWNDEEIKRSALLRDEKNNTLLHEAVRLRQHSAILRILAVTRDLLVNLKNDRGMTPLHLADTEIMARQLVDYGAHSDAVDIEGTLAGPRVLNLQCFAARHLPLAAGVKIPNHLANFVALHQPVAG